MNKVTLSILGLLMVVFTAPPFSYAQSFRQGPTGTVSGAQVSDQLFNSPTPVVFYWVWKDFSEAATNTSFMGPSCLFSNHSSIEYGAECNDGDATVGGRDIALNKSNNTFSGNSLSILNKPNMSAAECAAYWKGYTLRSLVLCASTSDYRKGYKYHMPAIP